jgi:hypothetical protein
MKKVLATTSLTLAGVIGFSGIASANFALNDLVNVSGLFKLEKVNLADPFASPVDVIFEPPLGGAALGSFADLTVQGLSNTGAFSVLNTGGLVSTADASIRSFNAGGPSGGLIDGPLPSDPFVTIDDPNTDSQRFLFSIELPDLLDPTKVFPVVVGTTPGSGNPLIDIIFRDVTGEVLDLTTGHRAHVRYDFTGQGLEVFADGTTSFNSFSATIRVIPSAIPEPSAVLALVAVGLLGTNKVIKRQLKK